ncbi:hypothetical protein OHC33_007920 [Knufia fluminis]|uniref:Heterokaryon incompatibility domain-containing protein n=1 Tax=Knufia fluminis TaxID=191047 RepID=A0AAN8I2F8_9EURO|nr:hypothetical protein OHC33_007920 [Knufia fluminis]
MNYVRLSGDRSDQEPFMPTDDNTLYKYHLADLIKYGFSFRDVAEAHQYSFIDCAAFCYEQTLIVKSFKDLKDVRYCTISYVRDGLPPLKKTAAKLEVNGVSDAHPISWNILRSAAQLSLELGVAYIWLDLICINQRDSHDKIWQTDHMRDIFKSCRFGIILPAGLQRHVRPEYGESTTLMTRNWTLQELVFPYQSFCIFGWSLGSGTLYSAVPRCQGTDLVRQLVTPLLRPGSEATGTNMLPGNVCCTIKIKSLNSTTAYAFLPELAAFGTTVESIDRLPEGPLKRATILQARSATSVHQCFIPNISNKFQPNEALIPVPLRYPSLILGVGIDISAKMGYFPGMSRFNSLTFPRDKRTLYGVVWSEFYKRTTRHPIDSVYSSMHLLDVCPRLNDLHGSKFARLAATLRMSGDFLRKGSEALWLSALFGVIPCSPLMDSMEARESPCPGCTSETPVYYHAKWLDEINHLTRSGQKFFQQSLDPRACSFIRRPEADDKDRDIFAESTVKAMEDETFTIGLNEHSQASRIALPLGHLDEDGYLHIEVPARSIEFENHIERCRSLPGLLSEGRLQVVLMATAQDVPFTGLVVQEHTPDRWHIACIWSVASNTLARATVNHTSGCIRDLHKQPKRKVAIGGPYPITNLANTGGRDADTQSRYAGLQRDFAENAADSVFKEPDFVREWRRKQSGM